MRKILIALAATLLAGCATGYGYSGYDGRGYGDYYYGSPSYRVYDDYYYSPYSYYGYDSIGYGRGWYGGLSGSWGYPWYGGYSSSWYGWPGYYHRPYYRPHYRPPHRPPGNDGRPPPEVRAPPKSRPLPAQRMPGTGSMGQPSQRRTAPVNAPRHGGNAPAQRLTPGRPAYVPPQVSAPLTVPRMSRPAPATRSAVPSSTPRLSAPAPVRGAPPRATPARVAPPRSTPAPARSISRDRGALQEP